jgi:hypothetical protein
MEPNKDWRIDNCKPIMGFKLRRKKYSAPRKDWDHDHCIACWAKFADFDGPGILHEGYATTSESKWGEDYHWVCPTCFIELHDVMHWVEVN